MKELLAWGPSRAEARLVKGNFHAKVIWWRGFGAYVGSATIDDASERRCLASFTQWARSRAQSPADVPVTLKFLPKIDSSPV